MVRGTRSGARLLVAVLGVVGLLAVALGVGAPHGGAATGDITLLGASTPGLFPTGGVVEGPDGHLWFANQGEELGEVDEAGNITLHPIDTDDSLEDVTVGGDGNIWFTVPTGGPLGEVGRFNPTNDTHTVFDSPVVFPGKMTTAADGTIWVLGGTAHQILLNGSPGIETANFGSAADTMLGPDDFLWITDVASPGALLRVDPATAAFTTHPAPNQGGANQVDPDQMTIGPDGEIWFGYGGGAGGRGGIGRYDVGGNDWTYFSHPTEFENAKGITTGPDGNLWYLGEDQDEVVRMTPAGQRTGRFTTSGFSITSGGHEIAVGPGDDLWAGENNRIARIDPGEAVDPACLPPAFSDVGTGHPFFADICWMDLEGISTGYDDGTYKPSAAVSRQAMSAFMYRLAGSPPFSAPGEPTFGDVSTTSPFYDEIEWMASEGITNGTPASPKPLYKPSAAVSRGAMSAFMYRFAEEPAFPDPPSGSFTDVGTGHPFFTEIEWMAEEEISTGYQPGPTYRPASPVSRQAMSAFMNRLAPLLPA